jgi:hypothetical protein
VTIRIQNPGKSGLIVEFVSSALLTLVRWSWASVPMTGKLGVGCFQRLDSSGVDLHGGGQSAAGWLFCRGIRVTW